ncbi:MAG TPA: hypothetical protein VFC46_16025 [Humisphaera sp.]|nr:hypothetical protein [Humisphaera sp.]
MPRKLRSVAMLLAMLLIAGGCMGRRSLYLVDEQNVKIISMNRSLLSVARDSIRREEHLFGKPMRMNYSIAIDPLIGDLDLSLSSEQFSDFEVPISVSYTCDSRTIDAAKTAVVFEAILGSDRELRSNLFLFQWDGGNWVSEARVGIEELRKIDPTGARRLEQLLEQNSGDAH